MYLETGKKSASIIIEISGFSISRDSVMNHRPLLLWPFAAPSRQVSAQWGTLCWVCQVAQPGQRHQKPEILFWQPWVQSKPGQERALGSVLQISWQGPAQGTAPAGDEAMVRKSSASERKDPSPSPQRKGNTHFAAVTTGLCGCKTRTSYTCQGKYFNYFSRFHRRCSCSLVTIKWQGKIPSSEALTTVKHWILKKCS